MNANGMLGQREDWIAQLTEIAYRAILKRGYRGSFLELELAIWQDVLRIVERTWPGASDAA